MQKPNLKIGFVAKMLTTVLSESTSNNANVISQFSHEGLNSPRVKGMGTGTRGGQTQQRHFLVLCPGLLHTGTGPRIFKHSKRTAALANSLSAHHLTQHQQGEPKPGLGLQG